MSLPSRPLSQFCLSLFLRRVSAGGEVSGLALPAGIPLPVQQQSASPQEGAVTCTQKPCPRGPCREPGACCPHCEPGQTPASPRPASCTCSGAPRAMFCHMSQAQRVPCPLTLPVARGFQNRSTVSKYCLWPGTNPEALYDLLPALRELLI